MPEFGGKVGPLKHSRELGGAQITVELYSHFAGLEIVTPEGLVRVRLTPEDIGQVTAWLGRARDIIEEGWEHDAGS